MGCSVCVSPALVGLASSGVSPHLECRRAGPGVASARSRRETWGFDCAVVGRREGSEGPRLGDQEDRQVPSFPEDREEQGPASES